MNRFTVPSVVLVVSLLTWHSAVSEAQGVKRCDLLNRQAAEAVYGAPLDPGLEMGMGCAYLVGGDEQKGVLVTSVPPALAGAGMSMSQFYDQFLHSDPTATAVPLSGLGDKAHFITAKDGMITVQVLYHNSIATVSAIHSRNPNLKAALTQAIRQVMQKL